MSADENTTPELEVRGKALYVERCRECHGKAGQRRALGRSKRLDALAPSEVTEALEEFQTGRAAGGMMVRAKGGLSDDDIRSLAVYVRTFAGP